MQAVTGCNGKEFNGNGWQRSRAAVAGNTQGNAVMQFSLDIVGSAGSAAR